MPVWILWALAAAGVGGALTWLTARALNKWLSSPGRVAFIGRNATGKTTMTEIMQHGEARKKSYAPTTAQRKIEDVHIGAKTFTLVDSGGDRLKDWKAALRHTRDVVYFFDAHRVAEGDPDVLSELEADAEHLQLLRGNRRFTVVGTHTDLFADEADEDSVLESIEIANLKAACGVDGDGLLLGALTDKKSGLRLAKQIAERHG